MVSTAIQIGLLPPKAHRQGCPQRVHVADVLLADNQLLADVVVYIGYGHFRHRLPVTEWELAIKSQIPIADFSQVQWRILEGVINDETFLGFRSWVHQQGEPADGPLGSMILPRAGVHVARVFLQSSLEQPPGNLVHHWCHLV